MTERPKKETNRRWSVEQRLAFIDRRLYWDAQINRSDLVTHFGVSVPQASTDLGSYEKAAPGNMRYDKHAKSYVAAPNYSPRTEPSAREYLAQLQLIADNVLSVEQSWIGKQPDFAVLPRVRRRLAADILQRIIGAIRSGMALEVKYQSFETSKPSNRWIVPHALSFDGQRWHVRAWCERRLKFLDFVLARMLGIEAERKADIDSRQDQAWHTMATMKLGPNPALPPAHRQAVALDYGMEDGVVELQVRLSLVYYLNRQMLLDVADLLRPERVPVVLLNADELNRALIAVDEAPI